MKIHLELDCETLNEVRAELANFLAPDTAAQASPTRKSKGRPDPVDMVAASPSAADVALGATATDTIARPAPTPAPARQARSAADVALGLETDDDAGEENKDGEVSGAEQLLADRAQLNFDFDRVLALQGRAAALGIVRGVLPPGTKTKIKDIEALPVALIPAAIAALQAAGAN
jgi:hypothetical protein